MSLIKKLITLFRGTAHEVGQKAVDANLVKILDQEMRDAGSQLQASKVELTKLMAQSKLSQDKLDGRSRKMAELSGYIKGALGKGDQALALDVANKLAPLEAEQATEQAAKDHLDRSVATLKETIKKTEARLNGMRVQIDQVKATEAVQKAQSAIAARNSGTNSQMASALDSLQRLQDAQAQRAAQFDAAEQLEYDGGDGDLNKRLANAGLLQGDADGHAILARFAEPAKQLTHEPAALPAPAIGVETVTVISESAKQ